MNEWILYWENNTKIILLKIWINMSYYLSIQPHRNRKTGKHIKGVLMWHDTYFYNEK